MDHSLSDIGGVCSDGIGECNVAGVDICLAGSIVCDAVAGSPSAELCDGLDNDCDTVVDNAPSDIGGACSDGIGE